MASDTAHSLVWDGLFPFPGADAVQIMEQHGRLAADEAEREGLLQQNHHPDSEPDSEHQDQDLISGAHRHRAASIYSTSPIWIHAVIHAARASGAALINNKTYLLMIFLPLGIAASIFGWPSITISAFNLLAIIPLSALVSYAADELTIYVGDLVGELINATFGNAVELIVGIIALNHGEIRFVQSAMLGSILSDILIVLGACLSYASFGNQVCNFNTAMVDALSSLMIITATALILPTALYSTFTKSEYAQFEGKIIAFSRGSALVLLGLYAIYLYFQLKTHNDFFLGDSNDGSITPRQERNEENEEPKLRLSTATIVLFASTVGIMGCTHLLIDSIDETAKFTHITKTFIAAILIPIASNAPECMTIIVQAKNGKVDFAIGVIVNSILQIALFVIPFLVILGWLIQQPMTLNFETFQTTMLFLAVLVVNRLLQDGKYTYVQGAMLVALYAVVATAFYARPDIPLSHVKNSIS